MKLSVIIPVYNVKDYLRDCINSIVNQDYKDIEIILVDDGSTDGSAEICDEYEIEHNNVCVIHKKNSGVSHSRNCGLRMASGELITFVDSDDTVELNAYSSAISFFDENIDIVHFSYKRIEGNSISLIGGSNELLIQEKKDALEFFIKGEKFNGSLCNKIFKRNLIKEFFLNEQLRINEDVLLCFQLFSKSKKSVFIDSCFYNYYIRKSTSTTNTTDNLIKYKDSSFVCRYIFDNVEKDLKDFAAQRLLNVYFGYFRVLFKSKENKNELTRIKKELNLLNKEKRICGKKNKLSYYLLKISPTLYCLIYSIYDKIRKPNWDVN